MLILKAPLLSVTVPDFAPFNLTEAPYRGWPVFASFTTPLRVFWANKTVKLRIKLRQQQGFFSYSESFGVCVI